MSTLRAPLPPQPVESRGENHDRRLSGDEILAVIPALNEADHIETCIRSLFLADDRIGRVRVVVADGGSTDGTPDIVERMSGEFPNVVLVRNPKRLQSAAINLAVSLHGEGREILVRCDAHSIYPHNFILDCAASLQAHDVESVVIPMDAVGENCFQRANAYIVDTPLGSGGSTHRGGRVSKMVDHGHHAAFQLSSFRKIGGYDETFTHNEDAEYDRRLKASGGRIFLDAEIRISYLPRSTPAGLARQYYNYGRGRARNFMKHGDRPGLRQMAPPITLVSCVAGFALAPFFPLALAAPAGYLALLVVASLAVAFRMKSACGLLAGIASGIMHFSWSIGFIRQYAETWLKGQGDKIRTGNSYVR